MLRANRLIILKLMYHIIVKLRAPLSRSVSRPNLDATIKQKFRMLSTHGNEMGDIKHSKSKGNELCTAYVNSRISTLRDTYGSFPKHNSCYTT